MPKKKRNVKKTNIKQLLVGVIVLIGLIIGANFSEEILSNFQNVLNNTENMLSNVESQLNNTTRSTASGENITYFSIEDIPEYSGESYVTLSNNIPYFNESEYITESFEKYSELDELNRCGIAYANICKETMPADGETRQSISSVKPTGWEQKKYDGEYLYNRCHLIGYQLSNENANKLNLITGTRDFNVSGMLPFENQVAEYIDENPNNHVLYRVTPIFEGDNLLASGVEIEAYSVEDHGEGICFNVYVYNVQPGITIDYKTGESYKS